MERGASVQLTNGWWYAGSPEQTQRLRGVWREDTYREDTLPAALYRAASSGYALPRVPGCPELRMEFSPAPASLPVAPPVEVPGAALC
jgi:hypothetical protein